jgi:hypothetical protein
MGQTMEGLRGSDILSIDNGNSLEKKRIGSFERIDTTRLSGEAAAFLAENQKGLRMHRIMLTFRSSGECM